LLQLKDSEPNARAVNPRDWENITYFSQFLKPNGMICGHDYYYPFPDVIENVKRLENLYNTKASDLKKYIRDTLKENLKENYSSFPVENILLEMFNDPEYSKHRVYLEIIEFQKN
jgi:hypothetical protein